VYASYALFGHSRCRTELSSSLRESCIDLFDFLRCIRNTRYGRLVRPYPSGTLTPKEMPSFAWRTRVCQNRSTMPPIGAGLALPGKGAVPRSARDAPTATNHQFHGVRFQVGSVSALASWHGSFSILSFETVS
jgi:hypothetical protein